MPQIIKNVFPVKEQVILTHRFFCDDCNVLFNTDDDSIVSYTIPFCFGEKKGGVFFDCFIKTAHTEAILPNSFPTSHIKFDKLLSPKEAKKKLKMLLVM